MDKAAKFNNLTSSIDLLMRKLEDRLSELKDLGYDAWFHSGGDSGSLTFHVRKTESYK